MRVPLTGGSIAAFGHERRLQIDIETESEIVRCGGFRADLSAAETIAFFLALRAAIVSAGLADDLRAALQTERERQALEQDMETGHGEQA